MKQFGNYDEAKKQAQAARGERLPEGAYVCKVLGVRYENGENGYSDRIVVQFDIAEGEHRDFFKKQYEGNTSEDKKWKGKVNIFVPSDDGSEKDAWTKKNFAGWTNAFEESNPGYSWDWDENKWKGKQIGIVFGTTGTVINNSKITYTEPRFAIGVGRVKDGTAPKAKFKSKNGYDSDKTTNDGFVSVPDNVPEEFPF